MRPPAALRVIIIYIFVIKQNGNKLEMKADKCVMSKITVILTSYACQITPEFSFLSSHQIFSFHLNNFDSFHIFQEVAINFCKKKKSVPVRADRAEKDFTESLWDCSQGYQEGWPCEANRNSEWQTRSQSHGQDCTREPDSARYAAAFTGPWMPQFLFLPQKALSIAPSCYCP